MAGLRGGSAESAQTARQKYDGRWIASARTPGVHQPHQTQQHGGSPDVDHAHRPPRHPIRHRPGFLSVAGAAAGAAGQALIPGQANSAGSSNTSLTTNSTGNAPKVTQNGSGTALKAESDENAPLALVGPTTEPPMTVNSSRRSPTSMPTRSTTAPPRTSCGQRGIGSKSPTWVRRRGHLRVCFAGLRRGDLSVLSGRAYLIRIPRLMHSITTRPSASSRGDLFFVNAGAGPDSDQCSRLCSTSRRRTRQSRPLTNHHATDAMPGGVACCLLTPECAPRPQPHPSGLLGDRSSPVPAGGEQGPGVSRV